MIHFDAAKLREMRHKINLAQNTQAKKFYRTQATVCRWERGQTRITCQDLANLMNFYGIEDANQFFVKEANRD